VRQHPAALTTVAARSGADSALLQVMLGSVKGAVETVLPPGLCAAGSQLGN